MMGPCGIALVCQAPGCGSRATHLLDDAASGGRHVVCSAHVVPGYRPRVIVAVVRRNAQVAAGGLS